VLDEIYSHPTHRLYLIKRYMQDHPEIRFLGTGDEYQNKPMERLACRKAEKRRQYYNKIIHLLFSKVITLKVSKRLKSKKDHKKLAQLKDDLFVQKLGLGVIARKYFRTITHYDQIATERCVSYLNLTAKMVGQHMQKKKQFKKGHWYLEKNGIKYYKGMTLVCRKYTKTRKHKLHVNYHYKVSNISKKAFRLRDITTNTDVELPVSLLSYFSLPACATCHSLQGTTCGQSITVFDVDTPFADREWFYTAITRATDLQGVYVYVGPNKAYSRLRVHRLLAQKVEQYRETDKQKDQYDAKNHVSVEWIKKELANNDYRCCLCSVPLQADYGRGDLEQVSVDRKDNCLGHTKENCQITCLRCNVSKK